MRLGAGAHPGAIYRLVYPGSSRWPRSTRRVLMALLELGRPRSLVTGRWWRRARIRLFGAPPSTSHSWRWDLPGPAQWPLSWVSERAITLMEDVFRRCGMDGS